MTNLLIIFFSTIGSIFILLAAVGLIRMPDFYLRVSVTTKAVTLGIGLVLIASAIFFNELSVTSRVSAIIIFLFLTAPVAAHVITRAAYFTGTKLWDQSSVDDIQGKYEDETIIVAEAEEKTDLSPGKAPDDEDEDDLSL